MADRTPDVAPIGDFAALTIRAHGVLYEPDRYPDVKDPSPVFHGGRWHLFGTGCGLPHGPEILHATAPSIAGPWSERPPVVLHGVAHIPFPSAPGVVSDGRRLHLFLQHDFNVLGGRIEHLVSTDDGHTFTRARGALRSRRGTAEAGVYDPDAVEIAGERYLTYAAMSVVGQPDLYLARSRNRTWYGRWERLGRILGHEQVPCHNQRGAPGYEWGLEGPQLLPIPGSPTVLLAAVCFLPDGLPGQRQRLLLAVADDVTGPYTILGAVVPPAGPDGTGENGHGTAVLADGSIHVVYQERSGARAPWRFMRATIDPAELAAVVPSRTAAQAITDAA